MACCGTPTPGYDAIKLVFECDLVGNRRRKPSPSDRAEILKSQHGLCAYCGAELETTGIHWDHFQPFSYTLNNCEFVASCPRCNIKKSDLIFETISDARHWILGL